MFAKFPHMQQVIPLKCKSQLKQTANFGTYFLISEKKLGMIFHENHLFEISYLLFVVFAKATKFEIVVCKLWVLYGNKVWHFI